MKLLAFCALLLVNNCSADRADSPSVSLQPWLVGLTAVVGFLLLVFVVVIVRRLLKKNRDDEEGSTYDKVTGAAEGETKQTSL
ncbi:small integral membrane protein 24-like isoform X2 [Cololabis saira]|uniref:small integral membrane protein 24-like isoform X2 n=1 Tax=Cololabis saira TaxID=129043 RepID=UPI002AD3C511|nr:small integral membrane protein 24-like isoform X2 [Cololabis saira]